MSPGNELCRKAASQLAKCGHARKRSSTGRFVPSKRRAVSTPEGPSVAEVNRGKAPRPKKYIRNKPTPEGPSVAEVNLGKAPRPNKYVRTEIKKVDAVVKEMEKKEPAKKVSKKKVKDASKKSDSDIVKKMKKADVDLPEVKEILREHLKTAYKKDAKRDADLRAVSKAKSYADPIFAKYWDEALKDEIQFLTAADNIKTSMKKEKKAFKEADFTKVKDMLTKFRKDGKSKRKWVKKQRKQLKAEGTDFKKNLRDEKRKDKEDAKRRKEFLAKKAQATKAPTPKKAPRRIAPTMVQKPPTPKKAPRRIAPTMIQKK